MALRTLPDAGETEKLARRLLSKPAELKRAVRTATDQWPLDGNVFEYMNQRRRELNEIFELTLDEMRQARDKARECVSYGSAVPSLTALERAFDEAERIRAGALDHWEEFDPNELVGPNNEYISSEEFLKQLADMMSPEAQRELQSRLACEPD